MNKSFNITLSVNEVSALEALPPPLLPIFELLAETLPLSDICVEVGEIYQEDTDKTTLTAISISYNAQEVVKPGYVVRVCIAIKDENFLIVVFESGSASTTSVTKKITESSTNEMVHLVHDCFVPEEGRS